MKKLEFNLLYLLGKPRWDTGVVPPEVVEFVAQHKQGCALDLGCGTGTNMLYLAQHGWQVDGIDFSWPAINRARRRLRSAGYPPTAWVDDVTRLNRPIGNYNYILDIGCYHQLTAAGKKATLRILPKLLAPGGQFMVYGHCQNQSASRPHGLSEQDIIDLSNTFSLIRRVDGMESGCGSSVWLWFERKVS